MELNNSVPIPVTLNEFLRQREAKRNNTEINLNSAPVNHNMQYYKEEIAKRKSQDKVKKNYIAGSSGTIKVLKPIKEIGVRKVRLYLCLDVNTGMTRQATREQLEIWHKEKKLINASTQRYNGDIIVRLNSVEKEL